MIRLGIVGAENYHAVAFSQLCNVTGKMRNTRVVAICGEEKARTQEVANLGQIPKIFATPEAMIGEVDGVLIVLRHGDLHARYALPFLDAGVPTWVDKPFAITPDDAAQMIDAARRRSTPLTSFSTLRYAGCTRRFVRKMQSLGGPITGTISGANHGAGASPDAYGGLPFYGIHVVELMTEIFGYGVCDVQTVKHHSHIQSIVRYEDKRIVNLQFLGDVTPAWHVTAYAREGSAHYQVDTNDCYKRGLEVILRMIRTGERPLTDEQLLESVRVMDEVARAASNV